MRYKLSYNINCNTGKVRSVNQDNFWIMGNYLEENNNALSEPIVGECTYYDIPAFAVFDGMGGEEKGETASYIASCTFDRYYNMLKYNRISNVLTNIFKNVNAEICKYKAENAIKNMGTTGAAVIFDKNKVYACNIGDSRIYRLKGNEFVQLSLDHCMELFGNRKPPLTQYLGIPETEFIIQPNLVIEKISYGERFLICSDGLTDMVDEGIIKSILADGTTIKECSDNLLNIAMNNGAKDNITIIICEIHKK